VKDADVFDEVDFILCHFVMEIQEDMVFVDGQTRAT
jgi:hypothetical protein